jgi:uncharacterized protein (TIGR02597 family)
MKLLLTISSTLVAASLAFNLHAQSVTTDPVGYVTFNVNNNNDQRVGVCLHMPNSFKGVADSIVNSNIFSSGINLSSASYYLLVVSGDAIGKWETVTSHSSGVVSIEESIAGFSAGDSFLLRPFWTLDTLFPDGGNFPQSSDVFNPSALLLLNDPSAIGVNLAATASFFYHDGSQGDAGWYNASGFSPSGNFPISPDVFITIRNFSGESASIVFAGSVSVDPVGIPVLSRSLGAQDNLIYNPLPVPITFSTSQLIEQDVVRPSPDVFNPIDLVLTFSASSAVNAAPTSAYLFHPGGQGDPGWYNTSGFSPAGDVEIPGGGALIIRRSPGLDQITNWSLPIN